MVDKNRDRFVLNCFVSTRICRAWTPRRRIQGRCMVRESETEPTYALRLLTDWFDWPEKYTFRIFLPVLLRTSLCTIIICGDGGGKVPLPPSWRVKSESPFLQDTLLTPLGVKKFFYWPPFDTRKFPHSASRNHKKTCLKNAKLHIFWIIFQNSLKSAF